MDELKPNLNGAQRRKLLKQQAIEEGRPIPKFGERRKQRLREERRARTESNPSASVDPGSTGKKAENGSILKPGIYGWPVGDETDKKAQDRWQLRNGSLQPIEGYPHLWGLPRTKIICQGYKRP